MKRVLLVAMAAMILLAPAANAQKVNDVSLKLKLEKSDVEIKDAKKGAKAATWMNRAKVYFESLQAPTKDLFAGWDMAFLKSMLGEPSKKTDAYWQYPWVKIYLKNNKVWAWEQTQYVDKNAAKVAIEALAKAYELDPKQAPKIKALLDNIINFHNQVATVSYDIQRYEKAQQAYETIFEAQSNPVYGQPDYHNLYSAGLLATYLGAKKPEMFARGEKLLTTALANGYADEKGDIYYYLFHCYYGQKAADKENVIKAKNALLQGIEKFPMNERVLDGLMQLYTSEEGVGDPADLVSLIEKALQNDPKNADLWFGRGRVFYKLKNYDECINSFQKVVEIKPDSFDGNYYLALFIMAKGDELRKAASQTDFKSRADFDAAYAKVFDTYKKAVPWFEKAHELKPDHLDTVDCLKSLCFRLREEGDYMTKYEKYNSIFKKLKGIE
ncbi:MAG: tetratricopeptide repeat protein [Rikenellaceae bacterium]|nr:tetratricopeptide repeat protein [Rikenellaceae bacterium]